MQHEIKYVHTNIIAKNWKNLAKFYIEVFDCEPIYPERDLSGEWLSKVTMLNNPKIQGLHLRLPGYGEHGPTLEVFQYDPNNLLCQKKFLNALGFSHIAFHVDDIEEILLNIIVHGGSKFGSIVKKEYFEIGRILTMSYAKDPEDNYIELQNWREI